jgi:hypothetical protein
MDKIIDGKSDGEHVFHWDKPSGSPRLAAPELSKANKNAKQMARKNELVVPMD